MAIGVVGKKCGMTQIFTESGESIPVTVIQVMPNRITQVKTIEKEGYSAIQLTTGARSRHNNPISGHLAKAKIETGDGLWEFRTDNDPEFSLGDEITIDIFSEGQQVDVTGISKGKGFAGTIKRHNFKGQPQSHGNSLAHRVSGSTGQNQSPRKVFKGKKMAGQMGNVRCTVQNQTLIRIDKERNLLLIQGGIPGAKGTNVMIKPAVKHSTQEESK